MQPVLSSPDVPARLAPLSRDRHGLLRLVATPGGRFAHAASKALVAVCLAELDHVAHEFPLAFMPLPSGRLGLVGLLGTPGKNLLVSPDGNWLGHYAPALIRVHPFGWHRDHDGRFVLCIDEASPNLSREGQLPLFTDDGSPSEVVLRATGLVGGLAQQLEATEGAVELLREYALLEPWSVLLPGTTAPVPGLMRVSEGRLRKLEGTTLKALAAGDALLLAYAQLLSGSLLGRLATLAARHGGGELALPSSPNSLNDLVFAF